MKHDSIKLFLVRNQSDTIDKVAFQNTSELKGWFWRGEVKRTKKNWSCIYQDSFIKWTKEFRAMAPYIKTEEGFLNRVITENGLIKGDELRMIEYWKQLNQRDLLTNIDSDWNKNLDSFRVNIIECSRKNLYGNYGLDKCEIEMYEAIYDDIAQRKGNEYWMSEDWIVEKKDVQDVGIFFKRVFKKCTISYKKDGKMTVELKGNPIRFR